MLVEKAAKEEELRLAAKVASLMERSILSEEDLEAVKKERSLLLQRLRGTVWWTKFAKYVQTLITVWWAK